MVTVPRSGENLTGPDRTNSSTIMRKVVLNRMPLVHDFFSVLTEKSEKIRTGPRRRLLLQSGSG
jgi:hypothetical protein